MQWKRGNLFNQCYWEDWMAAYKRMKLKHSLTPYTKINSQWIEDLNVRPETIKHLQENIEHSLTQIIAILFWICLLKQRKLKIGPN